MGWLRSRLLLTSGGVSDNPVLCDERLYELTTILGSLNARVSGACVSTQTATPVLMGALNDVAADTPVLVVTQLGPGLQVVEGRDALPSQLAYRRVGALLGHVVPREDGLRVVVDQPVTLPPENTNVVVKWPDESRRDSHPLADHLRLRDLNSAQ